MNTIINEVKYILGESVRMLNYRKISNLISVIIMGFSLLVYYSDPDAVSERYS